MHRVTVQIAPRQARYDVSIEAGSLKRLGRLVKAHKPVARRIVIVSNRRVYTRYGAIAFKSLQAAGFSVTKWLMGDGERFKNIDTLEEALSFFSRAGLERNDCVVALGGGVVCDLAGFAAAIYLRGVGIVHVPTTLLAQVDASVGGKTAVNTSTGKNLIGAFHHPCAVLIDTNTLDTLPPRQRTAGWCEAVKQGAVGSRLLFDQTHRFLSAGSGIPVGQRRERLAKLIAAQVAFKASIVAGDEREEISRMDAFSRRILNFGHTVGHALEAVTNYQTILHGEAVGYGMLVAGHISNRLGLLDQSELELLRDAVRLCGRLPPVHALNEAEVLNRIAHDKKSVAGSVKWVLLEKVGRARIVDSREIGKAELRASLSAGIQALS